MGRCSWRARGRLRRIWSDGANNSKKEAPALLTDYWLSSDSSWGATQPEQRQLRLLLLALAEMA